MANSTQKLIQALGFDENSKRQSSFKFSRNPAPKDWKAFTFDSPLPIYHIIAPNSNLTQFRPFLNGIPAENFLLITSFDSFDLLVIRRFKKGDNNPRLLPLRKQEDYDRVVNVLQKLNFTSDELTAHTSLKNALELIQSGAQQYFINRGLFSNYFLRERLFKTLSQRKRSPEKEAKNLLDNFSGLIPTNFEDVKSILEKLGYNVKQDSENEWLLEYGEPSSITKAIVSKSENLDVKFQETVPSYQAVAQLENYPWVILTNGRLWRLYSSRVSSSSTNYFEIDLEGITDEKDPKILYFISIFSALSYIPKEGISDLDLTYDKGVQYASEIESDLKNKIFNEQLFLNLIRGILDHSLKISYSKVELEKAKSSALKLLYRFLFILYAESRALLPIDHSGYEKIAINSLRQRLSSFEKDKEGTDCWKSVKNLFKGISEGNPAANLPQYDGVLFEYDPKIDDLTIRNKFLVPTIRDLTEIDGKGIDYQNLGVRHLGSLYEALLEYSVEQAHDDLIRYKDEILDASFASDLKQKPERFIQKHDIYLTVGGLARKGSGSYFTPDKIVKFLVRKGLEPIFQQREKKFHRDYQSWKKNQNEKSRIKLMDDLLDLQIIDPAMGSGHFLVAAVDELTRWIMGILQNFSDAPLIDEIKKDRVKILREQKKKGIIINEDLLTYNVLLKRMIMKRCIFGVDLNPLAVELAKLSLWLDSFTIGTPLTFLDHHIRCGDSLIGLWLDNLKQKGPSNESLDKWMNEVVSQGSVLQKISMPTDITIEQRNQSKNSYNKFRKEAEPLIKILDLLTSGIIDSEIEQNRPKNLPLVEETIRSGKLSKVKWKEPVIAATKLSKKYRFFHWELEFPDAFTDKRRGFDLVITNPPWDAIQPYDDDFFSQYYPGFRKIKSKPDKNKIKTKLLKDKKIKAAFFEFTKPIEVKLAFYRLSGEYVMHGSENPDTWKAFTERILKLITKGGTLSILLPSGIITNKGAKDLRDIILDKKIRILYEFENKNGIFPIHKSYKFVLMVVDNVKSNDDFSAAFYLHNIESIEDKQKHEKEKFVTFRKDLVKLTSPDNLIIPELRNQTDVDVLRLVYGKHRFLQDKNKDWTITLVEEFSRTRSAHLFRKDPKGWPLIEGKNFHQFIPDFEKPLFSVVSKEGLEYLNKVREYKNINEKIHDVSHLLFRTVASSTNVRTMIACIIPKHTFFPDSAALVLPKINGRVLFGNEYYELICYLVGIFNSMVFDFIIKRRVNMNLSNYFVNETAVPEKTKGYLPEQIIKIAASLSVQGNKFNDLATALNIEESNLTLQKRIDHTATLDALVAHHYGIDKKNYEYIVNSFNFVENRDILNKKELVWNDSTIKQFYYEVRKIVLQKYDEITTMVRNG